jgi:hypothetical protein
MNTQQKEGFRILARVSAEEVQIKELSAAELEQVGGAGSCGTAGVSGGTGGSDVRIDYDQTWK